MHNEKKIKPYGFHITLLAILIVAHRVALLWAYRAEYVQLLDANPWWLTWQYLDPDSLRYDLLNSLLYLQQTPPIPNLLFGIGLKLPDWHTTTYFFILLQTFFTLVTGILMFIILSEFTKKHTLIFLWVCLFVFSSDLLVMEYNTFGQSFYENLTMCFILLLSLFFLRWIQKPNYKMAFFIGILAGLTALSRATYSYFFLLPLLGFLLVKAKSVVKNIACYLLAVLLLQGAWSVKNFYIYDYLSPATSSWQGLNLSIGLARAGFKEDLIKSILANPDNHPDWFIKMIKEEGLLSWGDFPKLKKYIPQQISDRDQAIDDKLQHYLNIGNSNNSIALYTLSHEYSKSYVKFMCDHADLAAKKFWLGYAQFWMPIHSYSGIVMPFFHTSTPRLIIGSENLAPPFFDTARKYADAYLSPEQTTLSLRRGEFRNPLSSVPAATVTLPFAPGLASLLNLFMFNILIPCLLVYFLISRQLKSPINIFLLFLFTCISYLAFSSSLVEFGENMRFRMSVEPLLWISSFLFLIIFSTKIKLLFDSTLRNR